jgi:hypothetical protein
MENMEKQLKKIEEKLDRVGVNVAEIQSDVKLLEQTTRAAADTVQRHEHALRGNGDIGLVARVSQVEKTVHRDTAVLNGYGPQRGIKADVQALSATVGAMSRVSWIAIGAVITTIVGLLILG